MTIIHTLADTNFADNTMPVLSNDPYANVGTQLIFDLANTKCWAGGNPISTSKLNNLANKPAVSGGFQATQPTFATNRLVFSGAVSGVDAVSIAKIGSVGLPFFPNGDGDFEDTLAIIWLNPAGFPDSNAGLFGIGRSTGTNAAIGLQVLSGGALYEYSSAQALSANITIGSPSQIALHYDYDQAAGTTTIRAYQNGALVKTFSGSNPNNLTQDPSLSKAFIGHMSGATNGFNGSVYRFILDHTSVSGLTPDSLVAQDFTLNRSRFGL